MKSQGTVIKIEKAMAIIEMLPEEVCTKCCSCGASKKRYSAITGDKAKDLKIGDSVEIEVDASIMMKAYLMLYGLPLVTFTASVLIVHGITRQPGASFLAAIVNTAIVYLLVGKYLKDKSKYVPNVCVKEQGNSRDEDH